MKLMGVSILLLLTLATSFSKWALIAEYRLNQKYIAEKLCINRTKPKSCCAGKCYLGKQLNTDEQGSSKGMPSTGKEKMDIQLFCEKQGKVASFSPGIFLIHHSILVNLIPQGICKGCFHPPQA